VAKYAIAGGKGKVSAMTPSQRNLLIYEFGRKLNLPYPMGLPEMLEESLEIYRRNFIVLFSLALVPALFGTILGTIGGLGQILITGVLKENAFIAAIVFVYILFIFTNIIGYGAQIWAVGQVILGKPISFWQSWMAVLKRLGALMVTILIAVFPTVAGLLLCCVGIVFTSVVFIAVLEQIVLIEGVAYFRAISRHVQLVFPNWEWGRVLGFYLASWLIISVVSTLLNWISVVLVFLGEIWHEVLPLTTRISFLVISQLWGQMVNALVMPYWGVFMTLLYFDLIARREAYDLGVLVERWETMGR